MLFTLLAIGLIVLLAFYANRVNEQDRSQYRDGETSLLVLHVRQDVKLIVFLLGGVFVMLGVIADRM